MVQRSQSHMAAAHNRLPRTYLDTTCVSIYIPLNPRENISPVRMRLDKAIRSVEALLRKSSYGTFEKKQMIQTIKEHFYQIPQDRISRGIALFYADGNIESRLLQVEPPEIAVVAKSFHVKPLLRSISLSKGWHIISCTSSELACYSLVDGAITKSFQQEKNGCVSKSSEDKRNDRELRSFLKKLCEEVGLIHSNYVVLGAENQRRRIRSLLEVETATPCVFDSQFSTDLDAIFFAMHTVVEQRAKTEGLFKVQRLRDEPAQVQPPLPQLAKAALAGRVGHLFIDSRVNLWGQIDSRVGVYGTSAQQIDHLDDCVFDDIVQAVLKSEGQVSFIDGGYRNNQAPYFVKYRW